MNIFILTFHKYDKAFASDLYLIYNRSPAARVCKSDTDRLLMLYLVLKLLVSLSPICNFNFVFKLFSGSISDKEIVRKSGFLDQIEPDECIMADKGLNISKTY